MRRVPSWQGEFGLKLYHWVPQVHALCLREPCSVEIERGEEALFPAATEWRVTEEAPGHVARGGRGRPPDLGVEPVQFVPEPHESCGLDVDVVVCPRKMSYGESKNWQGWSDLAVALRGAGLRVIAAGTAGSSAEVPGPKCWTMPRPLDAAIESMRSARVVVATDAGLAHLAVLCGVDLLLITYRGLVAPGPVIDSSGRVARDSYWRAGWDPAETVDRYATANHMGARIERMDGWEDVGRVVEAVEAWS